MDQRRHTGGTLSVKGGFPSGPYAWPNPSSLTNVYGTLLFTADDGSHGYEVWKSDGTEAGTTLVQDIMPGAASSNSSQFTVVDDKVFFAATDDQVGTELWRAPLRSLDIAQPRYYLPFVARP